MTDALDGRWLNQSSRYELATIGSRWVARLIDSLLLIPLFVLDLATRHLHRELVVHPGFTTTRLVGRHRPLWLVAMEILLPALYEIAFVALRGQTIGKMAMHVQVVMDDGTGEIPGLGLSTVRYIVVSGSGILRLFSSALALVWIIDPLYALINDRNRCLHDLAAGTVVVRAPRRRQPMLRPSDEPSIGDIDLSRLRRDLPFPPDPPSLS